MVKYAIITPARDEEAFIEKTIASVASQSISAPLLGHSG